MKILVCYTRFPWPLNKGDMLTVYKLLEFLSGNHEVDLLTAKPLDESYLEYLPERLGEVHMVSDSMVSRIPRSARSLFTDRCLQVDAFMSGSFIEERQRLLDTGNYDLVYSHYIRSFGHEDFDSHGARKVIGLQLSHQAHFEKAAKNESNAIRRWLYAKETERLKVWESRIAGYNDLIHLISQRDLEGIDNNDAWSSRVFFNPHGVDEKKFVPSPESRVEGRVVFTGNLGFQANEDAVVMLTEEIWPHIERECPNAELLVAGARPTATVRAAVGAVRNGTLVASPEDMVEVIQSGDVAVDPLRVGAGLQNKILEAMACGLPVVATPLANGGIGARDRREIIIESDPRSFADEVICLINDRERNAELGVKARDFIEKLWTWEYHFQQLEERWTGLVNEKAMA
ncbi:glycosyltransferase [Pelagicoccus mobilis]|uniref:Glycosyltransferase n=1 Tax=Pelagicoccus mobilis TaxID=415221 RepID=A0A934VRT3_9BACT|nr:glycosyltransferase [Pelagicoccus mobilis]MBK1877943.1 glycosyltransferase [Pelagicoccus mobilis]